MPNDSLDQKLTYRVWGRERRKSDGYIMVYRPDHPRADKRGEVPKHTLVLEDKIGRFLTSKEVAHHVNHVRDDNRPENLRLMDKSEHERMHLRDAVKKRKRKAARRPKKVKPPPAPNAPKPYSPEDDAVIREHWTMEDKDIAAMLGRSKGSVTAHRRRLGLKGKPGKSGTVWYPQEEQLVRDMWGQWTIPQIADELGRTPIAVRLKARRLGLLGQMNSGEMMVSNVVAKLLGVDGHTVTDYWIPKCGLSGFALPRGDSEQTVTVILRGTLLQWLEEHQDLWDSRRLAVGSLWQEEPDWLRAKREADTHLPERRFAKWTPEEDAQLLALLARGGMSYKELGEAMHRSDRSIVQRVRRIGAGGLRQWKKGGIA